MRVGAIGSLMGPSVLPQPGGAPTSRPRLLPRKRESPKAPQAKRSFSLKISSMFSLFPNSLYCKAPHAPTGTVIKLHLLRQV